MADKEAIVKRYQRSDPSSIIQSPPPTISTSFASKYFADLSPRPAGPNEWIASSFLSCCPASQKEKSMIWKASKNGDHLIHLRLPHLGEDTCTALGIQRSKLPRKYVLGSCPLYELEESPRFCHSFIEDWILNLTCMIIITVCDIFGAFSKPVRLKCLKL